MVGIHSVYTTRRIVADDNSNTVTIMGTLTLSESNGSDKI